MKTLDGIVVKAVGGVFNVLTDKGEIVCFSPKKLRYKADDVVVGDRACVELLNGKRGLIQKVLPRKNLLARPELANVDVCFISLAPLPQPDFGLADKILINCFKQGIVPVILVNKTDISSDLLERAQKNYGKIADVIGVCAAHGDVAPILPYIKGKLVCFAGQSAVGKTSILNALSAGLDEKVGGISQKSGRGTHTTRHIGVYGIGGGLVADTCGFSLCDIEGVRSDELRLYFDDIVEIGHDCKFSSCTHTAEPDCAVKAAVANGHFCSERYDRYVELYNELLLAEKTKF